MTPLEFLLFVAVAYLSIRFLLRWIWSKPPASEPVDDSWGDTTGYDRRQREFEAWLNKGNKS